MRKSTKGIWVYNPRLTAKSVKISEFGKTEILEKCKKLIGEKLKPKYIKPFDESKKTGQVIDIYPKWRQNSILFIAVYKDLSPNAIAPEYEDKFARIRIARNDLFYLDYMRHTGAWQDITFTAGESLEECLQGIDELPYFEVF